MSQLNTMAPKHNSISSKTKAKLATHRSSWVLKLQKVRNLCHNFRWRRRRNLRNGWIWRSLCPGILFRNRKTGQEKTGGCIRILKKKLSYHEFVFFRFSVIFCSQNFRLWKPWGFPLFIAKYRWQPPKTTRKIHPPKGMLQNRRIHAAIVSWDGNPSLSEKIKITIPGTPINWSLTMDVWWNNHFPCKESSDWKNHL